jgi:hypothetical protein
MIKSKKPKIRTAAVFDNIDVFDVRFKKIKNKWKAIVKYHLSTDAGEIAEQAYENRIDITSVDIKKMEKLIATIVDGRVLGD